MVSGIKWMVAAAACLMVLAATSAAAEKTTLVITGEISDFFPVHTDEDFGEDPGVALEKELKRLREEDSDAIFIDSGNHLSVSNSLETAYTLRQATLFDELDYSIVNLSARDAAMSTVGQIGYQVAPKDYLDRMITNLQSSYPGPLGLPAVRTIDSGGMKLTFLSLEDKQRAGALSANLSFLEPTDTEDIGGALEGAEDSVLIAFSSFNDLAREDYFREIGRRPDVVIDSFTKAGGEAVDNNGQWLISAPTAGEILEVTLEKKSGKLEKPSVTRSDYFDKGALDRLVKYPMPMLGLPIPNLDEVMSQYFATSGNAVRVDTIPVGDFKDFSSMDDAYNIHVYHVTVDGEELHVYRNFNRMKDWAKTGRFDGGWPQVDMLVLVDGDHQLRGVVTRNSFPIVGQQTTVSEALNKLTGSDPSTWTPDPLLAAGLEELWHWAVHDLSRILELDRVLYGPDGILNTSSQ